MHNLLLPIKTSTLISYHCVKYSPVIMVTKDEVPLMDMTTILSHYILVSFVSGSSWS